MPKTLVTGGAGYIGSHTVQDLHDAGREVVVVDDLSTGSADALCGGVSLYVGDFADPAVIDRVFAEHEIDSVIHFAALKDAAASVSDPLGYYRVNVAKSIELLKTVVERGVERFVFSSTAAVYGNVDGFPIDESFPTLPENPYGSSKLMFEDILADVGAAYPLCSVSLRYFNAAGADGEFRRGNAAAVRKDLVSVLMRAATTGGAFTVNGTDWPTPDGSPVRDLVHVTDLARAHTRALEYLERGGDTLVANLGSESGFSVLEVARRVRELTGRSFEIVEGPRRQGDIAASVASSKRAACELGWTARHSSLDEVVSTSWAWELELERRKGGSDDPR